MMIILAKWNFLLRVFNKFKKFIIQRNGEKQGKREREKNCLLSSIKYHKLLSRFPLVVKKRIFFFLLGNLSVEIFFYCLFLLLLYEHLHREYLMIKKSFHNDKNYFPFVDFFHSLKKDYSFGVAFFKSFPLLLFLYIFLSSSSSSFYRLVLYSIMTSLCFTHSWYLKNKLYSSYFLVTVKSFFFRAFLPLCVNFFLL